MRHRLVPGLGPILAPGAATYVNDEGVWFRDPDGNLLQVKVGPKTTADHAAPPSRPSIDRGKRAVSRRARPAVHPRRLAHILLFTTDVERSIVFYREVLGLRLSDRSENIIAFMHAPYGSDHHLLGFAHSAAKGLHHTSWEVQSIDEIGAGAEQMRDAGYTDGWGLGRHVLGSNYFHYVRDRWGSWVEYSANMDYIREGEQWVAQDHEPEDSLYLWGPTVHPEFVRNSEIT